MRTLPARPDPGLPGRAGARAGSAAPLCFPGSCDDQHLAVWKFASCDGCQLSLLDCEDELLALAQTVEISHFLEATSTVIAGPYDVSLVEGSITTEADRQDPRCPRTVGSW